MDKTGILLEMRPCYLIVLTLALTLIHSTPPCAPAESVIKIAGAEFELVTIRPGTFYMGSDTGDGDERPVHKVSINYSFDIGKTEVTVGQFRAFVNDTGHKTVAEQSGGAGQFGEVYLRVEPGERGSDPPLEFSLAFYRKVRLIYLITDI